MKSQAAAFAIALSLITASCASNPTRVIALGPWGGTHVRMDVTSTGAVLEYDCAAGSIDEAIRPDSDGRFTTIGRHTPGHGGPALVGEILPVYRARYEGRIDGDEMSLLVTLTDTAVELGPFQLQRGNAGHVLKCL